MIEYERIDISEGIDLNKTNKSKECMLCRYYFLNKNFSYGPYLCDGCYNMNQMSAGSESIDVVYVKGNAYRIHFWHMSKHKHKRKRKAISLIANFNLIDKKGILYMTKAKQVGIKKSKCRTININDLDLFLLDIKKNLLKELVFITLITFQKILIVVIHCV